MREKPYIKQLIVIPISFSVLIVTYLAMNIFMCFNSVGKAKSINVRVLQLREKTYKHVALGQDDFVTGLEGKLTWNIKNLEEAFLVNLGNLDGILSFVDLGYFLLLNFALYIMFWGIKEHNLFSINLIDGFYGFAYVIFFYSLLHLAKYEVAGFCIEKLTSGKFSAPFRPWSSMTHILFMFLLTLIPPILKKAKKLQQEQDLTI